MSFGYSVGDVLAIYQLANKIRKDFANAPSQFKDIFDEVRNLSIVIQDIDVALGESELQSQQRANLREIATSSEKVLTDLVTTLSKYSELESSQSSLSSKTKRVWKRFKWDPDETRDLRDRITSNVSLLNTFLGHITNQTALETKKGVDRLNAEQDDQEKRRILDWVTTVDYSAQHNDNIKRRQEGTGQWLFESPKFQSWLRGDRKALFCPGIPGAGKTTLTAAVIDHLLDRQYQDYPNTRIAYIYCNFKWTEKQKLEDLLSNLLKQLAQGQSSVPDSVKQLYKRYATNQRRPPEEELSKALHDVASLYPKVFLVIDALDECQTSGGCRKKFIEELLALQASAGAHLFMTSRFYGEITGKFSREEWLEIRSTKADVEKYLEDRLQTSSVITGNMREDIKKTISEAVDGMFLLAKIYLDLLMDQVKPKKIRRMLGEFRKIPAGSDEESRLELLRLAYDSAMERIEQQGADRRNLAKQALAWITCAMRPLRKVELQHALTVDPDDSELEEDDLVQIDEIVEVCTGLVTIDEESDIIRLVHFTTQEYFDRKHTQLFPSAQEEITIGCITYLSFKEFECGPCETRPDLEHRLVHYALYSYAARNWGHHARRSSKLPAERILDFLKERRQLEASIQVLLLEENRGPQEFIRCFQCTKQFTPLHTTAFFGIYEGVHKGKQNLLNCHDGSLDLGDVYGRTPLSWAALQGHESMVRLLVENGANIESKDNEGRTPLYQAAFWGEEAVVKLLLENGANIESKDNEGRTPLYQAAFWGEEAVVKLLLENGANIKSKDNRGYTPLSQAAFGGHEVVVKLLLENGANIESKDNRGYTLLSQAAFGGNEVVVKLLLENGANIESKDNKGFTPLSQAAFRGNEVVVKLLLENGANIESKDNYGQTPLSLASFRGREAVIKLLLENGANIESKDNYGLTPLSQAAFGGEEVVVKLLLENGANIESKDNEGRMALSLASFRGEEAVIKLLLENGANVESKDNKGWTALSWANKGNQRDIVKLLLEKKG